MSKQMRYPNLEAEMRRYGVTQRDMAERLGKRPETICRWMHPGAVTFPVDDAFEIARGLFGGLPVDYLFSDTPHVPVAGDGAPRA